LGGDEALGSQVDLNGDFFPFEFEGIVGNLPLFFLEGAFYSVVEEVSGGYRSG